MLKDVVEVHPLTQYRVHLRFEDGVEGEIDLQEMIDFTGVFVPLRSREEFVKVEVHPGAGV